MYLSGPLSPSGWKGSLFIHPSSSRRFSRGYMVPGFSSIFPSLIVYILFEIAAPCIDFAFINASTNNSSIPRFISRIHDCNFFSSSSIFLACHDFLNYYVVQYIALLCIEWRYISFVDKTWVYGSNYRTQKLYQHCRGIIIIKGEKNRIIPQSNLLNFVIILRFCRQVGGRLVI